VKMKGGKYPQKVSGLPQRGEMMNASEVRITKQVFLDKMRKLYDAFPGKELKDKVSEGVPYDLIRKICGSPTDDAALMLVSNMETKGLVRRIKTSDGKIAAVRWDVNPHEIRLSSMAPRSSGTKSVPPVQTTIASKPVSSKKALTRADVELLVLLYHACRVVKGRKVVCSTVLSLDTLMGRMDRKELQILLLKADGVVVKCTMKEDGEVFAADWMVDPYGLLLAFGGGSSGLPREYHLVLAYHAIKSGVELADKPGIKMDNIDPDPWHLKTEELADRFIRKAVVDGHMSFTGELDNLEAKFAVDVHNVLPCRDRNTLLPGEQLPGVSSSKEPKPADKPASTSPPPPTQAKLKKPAAPKVKPIAAKPAKVLVVAPPAEIPSGGDPEDLLRTALEMAEADHRRLEGVLTMVQGALASSVETQKALEMARDSQARARVDAALRSIPSDAREKMLRSFITGLHTNGAPQS